MSYRLPVYRIALVREATLPAETCVIHGPQDAAMILRDYLADADREHVVALLLDAKHRVVAVHTVSIGTLDSSPVHPRETFKCAILSNAAAILLAHNHPSGHLEPSEADIALTKRIAEAGKVIGIPLLDHVIVAGGGYVSLRERGGLT